MLGEDDGRKISLRFNRAARGAIFARYARMEAGVDPDFDDDSEFIAALGTKRHVGTIEIVTGQSGDGLRAFIARHPQFWDEKRAPVPTDTRPARLQREYEEEEYSRRRAKEHESALAWAKEEERRERERIAEQSERLRRQLMRSNRPLRLPTPAEVAAAEERQRMLDEVRAAAQQKAEAGIAYWREYYEERARQQALNRVA